MAWMIDTTHSHIAFSVRHMMFARVKGSFNRWTAELKTDDSGRITAVSASVEINSIDTREAQRDAHLRSADFFDAENHPSMSFVGEPVGDTGGSFQIQGQLTIRGNTRPVTLNAQFLGAGKDPWGNQRRGYRATTTIDRRDFGLTWNAALELGGVIVGDEVEIEIDVEAVGS